MTLRLTRRSHPQPRASIACAGIERLRDMLVTTHSRVALLSSRVWMICAFHTHEEPPVDRNEMIRRLIEASIEATLADPQRAWLRGMLARGFPGYENMSRPALTREMQLRGLLEFDDPEPPEEFDDDVLDSELDDDEFDDGEDVSATLSARVVTAA